LVKGKDIHFVCLTHPHQDHAADLVPVLKSHPKIDAFWSTIHEIPAFVFGLTQVNNFASSFSDYTKKLNSDFANCFIDVLGAVAARKIVNFDIRSDLVHQVIDGVEIHFLSPTQTVKSKFFSAYMEKLQNLNIELPDLNTISAVLALKFGEGVVVLGADALKENWDTAVKIFHTKGLPKAVVFKVPHHGAKNSLNTGKKGAKYLDICSKTPKAKSVLFAGDSKHPNDDVFEELKAKTDTICLSNGRKKSPVSNNPLKLQMPGASFIYPAPVCNPVVSLEIDSTGAVHNITGNFCASGCLAN
jgi:ribonuclease BN (tRNA processing enzyme)